MATQSINSIPRQVSYTLTTSPTEIMAEMNNGNRQQYTIQNTNSTAVACSLGFGKDAVANVGIVLQAGVTAQDQNQADYKCWQGRVTAVANSGTVTISVTEWVDTLGGND